MIGQFIKIKQISLSLSVISTIALNLWASPSFAGDPFRSTKPHKIGDKTEAAFIAIFREGNYKQAQIYLEEAVKIEANEPLAHAMRASLAYSDGDLQGLKTYADKTLESAQKLMQQDPLRGNLYTGVGHFLQGAYTFKTQGAVGAVGKLSQVFDALDKAEAQDPNDPELNLLKGYLDLILSINLPFSSPQDAIARFEKYAKPDYMVDRAIATAHRDLKQYDQALQYINQALAQTPNNPEIQYLKGQILLNIGIKNKSTQSGQEAFTYFEQAMTKKDQLPKSVQISLDHDHRKVQNCLKENWKPGC
ncbi:tetratricopeptide TPR_2 [Rippkaea orientalis PCC 8801]|uniref:Tetratricopeptide TPR_2 n=1 Tax=Rippkaea orientalis (strain PCC 8801 / RF-1) TaxID=41431 RepID=B7JZ69_RIPO1|nr:Sll0314/Alr1548 family TPR repeat-containing protein [Rippkaea orientalis]ACK67280.1 tetratricopeptide TPR_2 [Rippkaea orientalis PCC 8801]